MIQQFAHHNGHGALDNEVAEVVAEGKVQYTGGADD